MLSEEMKRKIASFPVEEPDEIELQMIAEAEAENAGGESISLDEYFEKRKSNTVSLRIPKTLRNQLQENAQTEGVSLNQYCMYLLAAGIATNTHMRSK